MRSSPNIAISGCPGTGKSSLSKKLAAHLEPHMSVIDLGAVAKVQQFTESYDEELETVVIDEDKLETHLEPQLKKGGLILDWMHADFWNPQFIDLVVTLRCDNTVLFDRYTAREYNEKKKMENLDAEIMNDIGSENADYFGPQEGQGEGTTAIAELVSDTEENQKDNLDHLIAWVKTWTAKSKGAKEPSLVPFP